MQIYDRTDRVRWKDIYEEQDSTYVRTLMEVYQKQRASENPWRRVDRELVESARLIGANIRTWKTEYDRKIHVALELGSHKMTRTFNEMDMEPDEVLADLLGTLMKLKEAEDKYG